MYPRKAKSSRAPFTLLALITGSLIATVAVAAPATSAPAPSDPFAQAAQQWNKFMGQTATPAPATAGTSHATAMDHGSSGMEHGGSSVNAPTSSRATPPGGQRIPVAGGPNVPIPSTGDRRTWDGSNPGPAPAGARSTSNTIGPFLVAGGSLGNPGTIPLSQTAGGNYPSVGIPKPCSDCYVLGMKAGLVNSAGKTVDLPDKVMLHHLVLGRRGPGVKEDPTCETQIGGATLGQRFFASGNEHTDIRLPTGYGLAVNSQEVWSSFTHLMNWNAAPQMLSVKMTYLWVPKSQAPKGIRTVLPVWLDAAACNTFDTFELPSTGRLSTQSATWTSPFSGKIIGIGGHLHSWGVVLQTRNLTQRKTLCDSWTRHFSAKGWTDGHGMPGVSSMTRCYQKDPAHPLGVLRRGDLLQTTAYYDTMNNKADPKQYLMGIMVTFLDPN